jgi:hypothetical protein
MNKPPAGPLCPRCRRAVAAWRLDHCVYCGQVFPAGFRDGFEEPAALRWVERPDIPPEASRQLELMKIVPVEKTGAPRSLAVGAGLLSLPIFAAIFYLLYRLVARSSSATAVLVLIAGVGFVGYLGWAFYRSSRRS